MNINEAFPHQICINLDRRPERWEQMRAKFARCGIEGVRRFPAVDGQQTIVPANWSDSPGAYGCLRSHLQVVEEARRLEMPSVLIFEDDAALDPQMSQKFAGYFAQVPNGWEMLFFGANHMAEPLPVSENVARVVSANSTFAYALNRPIFDSFIQLNRKALAAVDLNNRVLQSRHNCFCFTPHLAWVEDLSSDVQVRQKYHWYLKESLVLHGSGMEAILKKTAVIIAYHKQRENALRNLLFLIGFYQQQLAGITVVVVEQDAEPTFAETAVLSGCKYLFLRDDGPLNRERYLSLTDASFLIFSDGNIFVEEWDIRGNLQICQRYDCATGFKRLVHLTDRGTQMLRTSKPMLLTPWFDANDYGSSEKRDAFEKFCVFRRERLGGAGLSVFESPNDALRMS
jgi:GR25 family glycosyltransferase involved in LPS biosynthesis